MSYSSAKARIIGFAGSDAELRYTPQGLPVANVSIAQNDKDGNTTWYNITWWGPEAEKAAQNVEKGDFLNCLGNLRQHKWVNPADDTEHTEVGISVTEWKFEEFGPDKEAAPKKAAPKMAKPAKPEPAAAAAKPAKTGTMTKPSRKKVSEETGEVEDDKKEGSPF